LQVRTNRVIDVTRHQVRLRVLIAEDHESVARQLRSLLEVECDVIDVVNDGHSLVAAVEALTPEVIVSDISMPGLDGLAAARIILERQPDARIVFVTVHDDRALARRALLLGVLGYVLKDDASEQLLPAVHAAQAGRQHLSESIRSRLI
jgi:DNA-binding NarL/FixJ family response regulator